MPGNVPDIPDRINATENESLVRVRQGGTTHPEKKKEGKGRNSSREKREIENLQKNILVNHQPSGSGKCEIWKTGNLNSHTKKVRRRSLA